MRNGQAAAYVCDGRWVEAWLQGTIVDGRLTVQGSNGARATGAVEGNAIFGTVWVNGARRRTAVLRRGITDGLLT